MTVEVGSEFPASSLTQGALASGFGPLFAASAKDPQYAGGAKGDWNGSTGTDDSAALAAVFNSGVSLVFLPTGDYLVANEVVVTATVRILGPGRLIRSPTGMAGKKLVRLQGSGSEVDGVWSDNPSSVKSASGAKEVGFSIEAPNCYIHNCNIRRELHGIIVEASVNGVNNGTTAEVTGTRIEANIVWDCLGVGPGTAVGSAGEDRGDGIVSWGSRTVIVGNIVAALAGTDARVGIHCEGLPTLHSGGQDDRGSTIAGNIISGSFRRGVACENTPHCVVSANAIEGVTWWGIGMFAHGMLASGNTIILAGDNTARIGPDWAAKIVGVYMLASQNYYGMRAINNNIRSAGKIDYYCWMNFQSSNKLYDCEFANNDCDIYRSVSDSGSGYTVDYGMVVDTPIRVKIDNNRIRNTLHASFYLAGMVDARVRANEGWYAGARNYIISHTGHLIAPDNVFVDVADTVALHVQNGAAGADFRRTFMEHKAAATQVANGLVLDNTTSAIVDGVVRRNLTTAAYASINGGSVQGTPTVYT
jgi:hypothetical protein